MGSDTVARVTPVGLGEWAGSPEAADWAIVLERADRAEARAWYLAVLVMAGRAWAEGARRRSCAWNLLDADKNNWPTVAALRREAATFEAEADALYGYASRAEVSL